MKSSVKTILKIIAAILVVVAIAALVVIYYDRICEFFSDIKNKIFSKKSGFTREECEDFADI